jgi:class 3 adenylate cyclase/tetratricopeptide (TPR) repeat protein
MVKCPGCGEENPPKFRLCGYCGTALAAAPAPLPVHEVRKTVTIVFSDLKGSTALGETLDAEALHEVKERYFNAMAAEIARHGGKIEKYIGDAIMAVFGLPKAHEDDALRAVRAAVGMREALSRVNADLQARYGVRLGNRTGVNTGEVVANDDPSANQKLATGDAVNVAARLEQAAPENEVYLGEMTYQLVRDAVEVEFVEPLELKGKAQRVSAYRLVSAQGLDGNVRRVDTPIVGRDGELAAIAAIYREVADGRSVRLVTVFGDAGVGKSRLVHEVVERIADGARVLRGRCLAYGEGITFWPLRVMLGAAGIRDDDKSEAACAKLLDFIGDQAVVDRLAAVVGLRSASFPMHETYWAARRVLEILAAKGPVVALVDDIHWAEPAFLELLEHVLDTAKDVPILLLATTRHDLREDRPQWGEREHALNVVLKPLDDSAAAQVVSNLLGNAQLPEGVTRRIVEAAEGNPLYVEQMLSMLIDSGALKRDGARWVRADETMAITVPPTIHALLEARLDRLGRAERAAVEPAAVIGLEFAQPAVRSLVPEPIRPEVHQHLSTLTAKQFIRVSRAVEAEPIYRFQHQLVRDTVYNGLLKRARATMHIEFVKWADKVNADRNRALEFEEILGYHLEQATNYLKELGPLDDTATAISVDAARRLGRAGKRAFARADFHAAVNLFRRATQVAPAMHIDRLSLLPELGEALQEVGNFDEANRVIDEAIAAADQIGDARLRASSRLRKMFVRLYGGEPGDWSGEALRASEDAVTALMPLSAHDELAIAWRLTAFVHGVAGRYAQANEATVHYMRHAKEAGNKRLLARSSLGLANGLLPGPTPVREGIAQCERIMNHVQYDRHVLGIVMCITAQLKAMNGEFDTARELCRQGRSSLRELGNSVVAAQTGIDLARIELLAGDLAFAERELRVDFEFLRTSGETYVLATVASVLGRILRDLGRDDEAIGVLDGARQAAADDDVDAQVQWRSAKAPILARQGFTDDGVALARQAVTLAATTDAPLLQAESRFDLGETLYLAGRVDEAVSMLGEAAEIWALKGDQISSARAKRRASTLGTTG